MHKTIRIGTRESQLAVWQATLVKNLLASNGYNAQLVYIKSDGDIDLKTPLYEMGVQGIFTRSLDVALLNETIDIAVHSMKDVPTQLPKGIIESAILQRASYKDILVFKNPEIVDSWQLAVDGSNYQPSTINHQLTIATSSIRRKAQWLHRYPNHTIENLRGNVNTRLKKVSESNWHGAIFAAAGLERINLRPENSIDLDWMLPAPAQGAIMVVSRENDAFCFEACHQFHHINTAICTHIERDFLRALLGGCSTPISALAQIQDNIINFKGNIVAVNGTAKVAIEKSIPISDANGLGYLAAKEILEQGGKAIVDTINHAK